MALTHSSDRVPDGKRFDKYERARAYHWGKLAGAGVRSYHARLHARYEWFLQEVDARRQRLIVDVGCGDGALTHLLSRRTPADVIGVEPDPSGLELAQTTLAATGSRASVQAGSADALPVDSHQVTSLILCEVIEHLARPDECLEEATRVLAPGGQVLISTPQAQSELADPLHVREFTAAELEDLCASFFADVEVFVAEPGFMVRLYSTRSGRLLINAPAVLRANPFGLRRPASATTSSWRQLFARARTPLNNAPKTPTP